MTNGMMSETFPGTFNMYALFDKIKFLKSDPSFITYLHQTIDELHLTEEEVILRLYQIDYLIEVGAIKNIIEAKEFIRVYPEFLSCTFNILYENSNVVALNKPFDVRVDIPIKQGKEIRHWDQEVTPADWFKTRYPDYPTVWLCHQLDHATSGILLLAKSRQAAASISKCFEQRTCQKEYLAIVNGHVCIEQWNNKIIEFYITHHDTDSFKMKALSEKTPKSKLATTKIQILKYGYLITNQSSLITTPYKVTKLLLKPITGRRHQLRLLTSTIMGHPILGDYNYGTPDQLDYYRLCLHAARLTLPAIDNSNTSIEAPDPFQHIMTDI